jgi:hypothetical protein
MQAVTAILKQEPARRRVEWSQLMTGTVAWLTRIFGCWHREISRPFTLNSESYRVCLECGAQRQFNLQTWEMTGPFYYQPTASPKELHQNASAAVRSLPARPVQRPVFRVAA